MPNNRKFFPHKSVLIITTRIEEGLPLVPTDAMNLILWGIVARASELYDVEVCHFVFMGNHLHLLLVVSNPGHVELFIGYIKCESAHAVNRLLGRRQRTIWQDGYDSPIILSPDKVEHYIKYLYLNPTEEDLESSIDRYPGVSTWSMFLDDIDSINCPKIARSAIEPLALPAMGINEQRRLTEKMRKGAKKHCRFTLKPWAWLASFNIPQSEQERIKQRLLRAIRAREAELALKRKQQGKRVAGSTSLKRQSMLKEHTPKKFAPRMICICEDSQRRRRFIEHFRNLCAQAREVYLRWKLGDFSLQIPPGLCPPRVPLLSSALAVPI